MTFSPRAIEAACEAFMGTNDLLGKQMEVALSAALAVDGVALVPREPTAEMFCAAVPFPAHLVHERDDPAYTKRMEAATLADRLHARQIWLDMLAAASDREELK